MGRSHFSFRGIVFVCLFQGAAFWGHAWARDVHERNRRVAFRERSLVAHLQSEVRGL